MPSKQSEAVRRRWEASRLAMVQPGFEAPDDESWGDLTAEPRGVDYLETKAGGLPAMWAVPKRASTDRVLMCIHGGGFVSGSIYTHRKMFGHLAKAAGARALLVSYHLLPEGVFPVPADDVTNAYRWLLDQGISAGRIAASPPRSPATATALTGWASSPSRRQASPASPCSAVAPTWRPSSASRWSAREPRDKHRRVTSLRCRGSSGQNARGAGKPTAIRPGPHPRSSDPTADSSSTAISSGGFARSKMACRGCDFAAAQAADHPIGGDPSARRRVRHRTRGWRLTTAYRATVGGELVELALLETLCRSGDQS